MSKSVSQSHSQSKHVQSSDHGLYVITNIAEHSQQYVQFHPHPPIYLIMKVYFHVKIFVMLQYIIWA